MRRSLIICLALTIGLTGSAAGADERRILDPDDDPGKLDLRWVSHGHQVIGGGPDQIEHGIGMWDRWRTRVLRRNTIEIWFNIDPDPRFDRRLTLFENEHRNLVGLMETYRGRDLGYAYVRRPDRRSVSVSLPVELFAKRRPLNGYRWYVVTYFHRSGPGACGEPSDVSVTCVDRVPDGGTRLHRLD